MARAAQNSELIYQSVTDPIHIGNWLPENSTTLFSSPNILTYIAYGLIGTLTCVVIYQYHQIQILLVYLPILQNSPNSSSETPIYFVWHHPTSVSTTDEPETITLTSYHFYITLISLMFFLILYLLFKFDRTLYKPKLLLLQFSNAMESVYVPVMKFSCCPRYVYLSGQQAASGFDVIGPWYYPKLSFNCSNIVLATMLNNDVLPLNELVNLSLFPAYR